MAKQQYTGGGFEMGSKIGAMAYGSQNTTSNIDIANLTASGKSATAAAESKVASYLDAMSGSMEFDKIPPKYREQVTQYLADARLQYAEAARTMARFKPGTDAYTEARGKINDVNQAIKTLGNQFTELVERKKELPDFQNGLVSAGNNPNDVDFLTSALTDSLDLAISPNGTIGFVGGDGNVTELNSMPGYFNKDFKSFDQVLKFGNSIYQNAAKSGQPLDEYSKRSARLQLESAIRKGGRQTLLSLAQDDFLIDGGLMLPKELLNNPEREAELREAVINGYMSMYDNASAEGLSYYQRAQELKKGGQGSGSGDNSKPTGYGKNTQEDINMAKSAWQKVSDVRAKAVAAIESDNSALANEILKEYENGVNFEFYSTEDAEMQRQQKSSWYLKPEINEKGEAIIMYKRGSKGDWQYISEDDFNKEIEGKATYVRKNRLNLG